MSQTVAVRFRPLKLITCVCGVIALILIIIALCGIWLKTNEGEVSDSLWESCEGTTCTDPARTEWLDAVRAFAILSLLLCAVATCSRVIGWMRQDDGAPRYKLVAGIFMACAMVSIIIALIIFPVMTLKTIPYRINGTWYFHWAYGVAWGGVIFMIGFIILLFIPESVDRSPADTVYKDKIYYVNSASQFETNA